MITFPFSFSKEVNVSFSKSTGDKINQIAFLGSEMMHLRRKKRNKLVNSQMADILQSLALLGATLDIEGWIITED